MASHSSGDVSNKMTNAQTAGLGFRVKSGWAAVVLLSNTARSPQLSEIGRIELCDPRLPETRQPYHAAMGKLETDSTRLNQREHIVRSISQRSLTGLLKDYRQKGFRIRRAALVVGSQINPADIANPHIRAHALEGRLFRSAVEQTLRDLEIRTDVLLERDVYPSVAARLKQSSGDVKRTIQDLGQSAPAKGRPWRAEQKLAALAALFALG
jgi:DNA-binding HxlR family transcriptional regulator